MLHHSIWVSFFVEYCKYLHIKTVRLSYNQHKLYPPGWEHQAKISFTTKRYIPEEMGNVKTKVEM